MAFTGNDCSERSSRYYLDNGFPSAAAMAQYHAPIVAVIASLGLPRGGRVLDLGCGNGALLARLRRLRPDIIPCGIERIAERLSFADTLFPSGSGEWHLGNIFTCAEPWADERSYAAALLMVGRLTEAERDKVQALRQRLRRQAKHIVGYAYPDWLLRYGNFAALCAAAGVTPSAELGASDFVAPISL